ncbi:MAG: glycosyltransferase family 4 protein [candidate division WOR-3 bacterium]
MQKIRVFLLSGNLPLYTEMLKFPPKHVKYLGTPSKGARSYYSKINEIRRKTVWCITQIFKIPRMVFVLTSADIIHSNRGICVLNRKPWIIDVDHPSSFLSFSPIWNEEKYRKIPEKLLSSKFCKKIMPWSWACFKSMISSFSKNERIKEKMEVLYPATFLYEGKKKAEKEFITLLYVSSLFKEKGGMEVLKAFEILRRKFDVKLIFKCDVPDEIKEKFKFPEIEFYQYKKEILPREKLLSQFFARADIFVYPTYFDIFGLGLLDALAVGLPIVATDVFAVPEIVEDNKNGFLIHSPIRWHDETYLWNPVGGSKKDKEFIVKQLVEKLSLLIEDSSLRRRMGRYSRRLVERGRFSIKERNEKLRKIYEEAIR